MHPFAHAAAPNLEAEIGQLEHALTLDCAASSVESVPVTSQDVESVPVTPQDEEACSLPLSS